MSKAKSYINEILAGIQKIAAGDFLTKIELSGEDELLDSIAVGINMLGEELKSTLQDKMKQARDLRDSEIQLNTILTQLPTGITIMDTKNQSIRYVNKMAEKLIGLPIEQILGTRCQEYFSPAHETEPEFSMASKVCENGEFLLKNSLGENIPILNSVIPFQINETAHQISCFIDISEQKNASRKLRENQHFIQNLIDIHPNMIYIFDLGKKENVYSNRNMAQILGCSSAEVKNLGSYLMENILHPGDFDKVSVHNQQLLRSGDGEIFEIEYRVHHESGKWIWLLSKDTIFARDEHGKPTQILGTALDITDRKRIENELQEAKERFEIAVKGSSDGIWDWNLITSEYYISPHWKSMIGYNDDELKNEFQTFLDHLHPEDYEPIMTQLKNYLEGQATDFQAEFRFRHKQGDYRWILARGEALRDEVGFPYRMAGSHTDITKLKQVHDALRESEETFRSISTSAMDAIFMLDTDACITFWNPAAEKIFGYSQPEVIGKKLQVPEKYQQTFSIKFEHMKDDQVWSSEGYTLEMEGVHKEGWAFPVSLSLSTVKLNNKWQAIGILRDISRQKRFEEDLKLAKERAEAANVAKSIFLANMSHEIRTPLNAILGFSEILNHQINNEKHQKLLKSIISSGKSLLSLINDILDLSKIEAGKLELNLRSVSLNSICNEIGQIFSWTLQQKGLEFQIEIDPLLPQSLILDEVRIRQILLNLVGNAIKFTDVGKIRLSAAKGDAQEDGSSINLFLAVEDSGIGIPEDQQESIFEFFKQMTGQDSGKYGGTGLGLAITHRLVDMMGGRISVESHVGEGSIFQVDLKDVKIASILNEPKEVIQPEWERVQFQNPKILVVDDIQTNRELVKEFLEVHQVQILEALNGVQAIEITRKFHPDLILMDIKMPVLDGYSATQIIKSSSELEKIPVIALTASVLKREESKSKKSGCNGYLKKPICRRELITTLMKFLPYENLDPIISIVNEKGREEGTFIFEKKQLLPETMNRLPELLLVLQEQYRPRWLSVKNTLVINNIISFAEEINKLGDEFQVPIVSQWGSKLYEEASNFDMENLMETLDYFPRLLQKLVADEKIC